MEKIKRIIKSILYSLNELRIRKEKINKVNLNENLQKDILEYNCKIKKITTINLEVDERYKWVGAVNYQNNMYCIPNTINKILKLNLENDQVSYLEFDNKNDNNEFQWTGGCIYNDKIYGFLRASNKLLCINPKTDEIKLIDLKLDYIGEHHYGGVCTQNGIIYQAPRNCNHILAINLNDFSTHRIKLSTEFIKYRYLSGVQHPNGLIYFLPERNEKVLVLDPKNEKFYFIGNRINSMVYNGTIGEDNNIYGFSNCEKGILKVDTKNNTSKMICEEIGITGCYSNKLGLNGKIYGIPGNGKHFWEFDIKNQKAKKFLKVKENIPAKCAGGVISKDGSIYTVPAFGNKIYKLEFNNKKCLSTENLTSIYFSDNY